MPGDDLDERLERAVSYLEGTYEEPEQEGDVSQAEGAPEIKSISADPAVQNFYYALADGKLYYREAPPVCSTNPGWRSLLYVYEAAGKGV